MSTKHETGEHAARRPRTRARRGGRMLGALAALPAVLLSCTTMEGQAERYIRELPPAQTAGGVITEGDLAELPPVVQRYFRYSQVVGKPRIDQFSFVMRGRIRQSPDADWMPLIARQYNLLSHPTRIYYIKASGTPMSGVDSYLEGEGRMQIKLFNLITIGDVSGPEMSRSALVTFMNDLILCPLGYFSLPVQWEQMSDHQARLSLTDHGMTVSATITFDEQGRVVNWESDDRFAEVDGEQFPDRWSTPMHEYGEVNGLRIPVAGIGIHDYTGEPYTYVELDEISALSWVTRGLPEVPALPQE